MCPRMCAQPGRPATSATSLPAGGIFRRDPRAGWLYKDWEGIVYPREKPKGFDQLRYIADFFDTVEINSSFYGPPLPKSTASGCGASRIILNSASRPSSG